MVKQQNGKELGHEPLGGTVSPTGAGCKGFSQRPDVVSRFSCRISTNCSSAGDYSSLSVHLVKPNLKDC